MLKSKLGRSANAQIEVWKLCKCSNQSSGGLQVLKSKFGRSASAQIEVWETKYHGVFAVGGFRNRYVRAMMISDATRVVNRS